MQINYDLYTLPNGGRVLLIPSDTVNSISIKAIFESGSALENEKTQGITHFVEHMSLTCTKKWPTKEILNEIVEFNGGKANGSTGQESLDYSINIPMNKLSFGLEYIYEVIYNSIFTDSNLELERTVILDEISKYEDNVYYKASEFIDSKILKKKSSYRLDIAGTSETVKSFTKEELLHEYKTAHDPSRMLLTVIGNFNSQEAKHIINKLFSTHTSTNIKTDYPHDEIASRITGSKHSKKTDLILSDTIFQFKGDANLQFNEDITLSFILKVLCGPMSSRLMKRLREKEGLLYGIYSDMYTRRYFGKIQISYEVKPEFYQKTLNILLEELNRFYEIGITQKEFDHYKEYLVNRLLVKYDNIYALSSLITAPIFNRTEVHTLEEIINETKNLSVDSVNSTIKEILNPQNASFFAFGNVNEGTEEILKTALN